MKKSKILLALSIVLIFSMAAAGTVLAEEVTIDGTVTWFDEEGLMMTMETVDGEVLVYLYEGFVFEGLELGSELSLIGEFTGEGVFTATGLAGTDVCDPEDPEADCPDGEGDGEQEQERRKNAFCDADKKESNHPFAAGIAATYGVSEEEVMELFCQGYSVGAIMLAFQTAEMYGADPYETLAQRDEGKGWGKIWKEAGLLEDADEALPPGQAKKLENAEQEQEKEKKEKKDKKDKDENPGNGGNPPGKDKDKPSKDGGD